MIPITGYDIDGVLTAGVVPERPYVVISGRTVDMWSVTVRQLGSEAPIYLRPFGVVGDRDAAGLWKATIIGHLGLERFFEDDPLQADIIRRHCPTCEVILVEGFCSG